jgi:ribosomal protein S18 acetylase RimI-like enzyme
MPTAIAVQSVPAAAVRPLRSLVLRPGQPPEALVYDGDEHPDALHAAVPDGARLAGIATIYPEPPPAAHRGPIPEDAFAEGAAFRLRGMATHPEARQRGLGRALLEACFAHARQRGAGYLWCNARISALGFYQRMGMETVGDEFDIPGIGPHYVMWCRLP